MTARILSGKEPADALLERLRGDAVRLRPSLAILQIGNDDASKVYIARKMQACDRVGIAHSLVQLPVDASLETVLSNVSALSGSDSVSGLIVQMPLPDHLSEHAPLIMRAIDPRKDVDGCTAYNLGKSFLSPSFEHLPPATPAGILHLLSFYNIDPRGKHAVIVGRSNTVGKPLAFMLLNRGATITVCHSETADLAAHTRIADILVTATGKQKLITGSMVKPGAVVIDVGITRSASGIVGDIDAASVLNVASALSPVPGGVGPMTVACLMQNCVRAKERQADSFVASLHSSSQTRRA